MFAFCQDTTISDVLRVSLWFSIVDYYISDSQLLISCLVLVFILFYIFTRIDLPVSASEPRCSIISFHFISFYLFTAYEEVTQLVKDNTT